MTNKIMNSKEKIKATAVLRLRITWAKERTICRTLNDFFMKRRLKRNTESVIPCVANACERILPVASKKIRNTRERLTYHPCSNIRAHIYLRAETRDREGERENVNQSVLVFQRWFFSFEPKCKRRNGSRRNTIRSILEIDDFRRLNALVIFGKVYNYF